MNYLQLQRNDRYHISMVAVVLLLAQEGEPTPENALESLVDILTSCVTVDIHYREQIITAITALLRKNKLDETACTALKTAVKIIQPTLLTTYHTKKRKRKSICSTTNNESKRIVEKPSSAIIAVPVELENEYHSKYNQPTNIHAKLIKSVRYSQYKISDAKNTNQNFYWRPIIVTQIKRLYSKLTPKSKLSQISEKRLVNLQYSYVLSCEDKNRKSIEKEFKKFKTQKQSIFDILFVTNSAMLKRSHKEVVPQVIFKSASKYPCMHDWQLLILWIQSLTDRNLIGPRQYIANREFPNSPLNFNLNISIVNHKLKYIVELGNIIGETTHVPTFPHTIEDNSEAHLHMVQMLYLQFNCLLPEYRTIANKIENKPSNLNKKIKIIIGFQKTLFDNPQTTCKQLRRMTSDLKKTIQKVRMFIHEYEESTDTLHNGKQSSFN